jgi:hypothetical protein
LADNRKLRLIGINSPETSRDKQPAQALAIRARDHLRRLLFAQGNKARAADGPDNRDRHGRRLAHLWLEDGRSLSAEMLRAGLAWAISIPPNTRWLECYRDAEQSARAENKGVWAHPDYAVRASAGLTLRSRGFHLVRGRVVRVNHGAGATWINLEGRFAARIPDQDLRWFAQPPDRTWIGRQIEVRGWVYPAKGELRVTVRHPGAIESLTAKRSLAPGY